MSRHENEQDLEARLMPGEVQLHKPFGSVTEFTIDPDCTRATVYKVVMTNDRIIVNSRSFLFCFIPYNDEYSLMTKEIVDVRITGSRGGWIITIISASSGLGVLFILLGFVLGAGFFIIGALLLVVALVGLVLYIIKLVRRDMDVIVDVCKDKAVVASWKAGAKQARARTGVVTLPAPVAYSLYYGILEHPAIQMFRNAAEAASTSTEPNQICLPIPVNAKQ